MTFQLIANSAGLLCNIIGAILLWKFGLPEKIDRDGHGALLLEQISQKEIKKAERYDCWSNTAVSLLVIGFVLQLMSPFLRSVQF